MADTEASDGSPDLQHQLLEIRQDPKVIRLAIKWAGDRELAEDALQTAYYRVASVQDPERILNLRAYFLRTLKNEITGLYSVRQPVLLDDLEALTPAQSGPALYGPAAEPAVDDQACNALQTQAWLKRHARQRAPLIAAVPGRSADPARYRNVIYAAAKQVLLGHLSLEPNDADVPKRPPGRLSGALRRAGCCAQHAAPALPAAPAKTSGPSSRPSSNPTNFSDPDLHRVCQVRRSHDSSLSAEPEEAEMTIETVTEHDEPDPGRADPALRTPAEAGQEAQAASEPPADAALQAHATDTMTRVLHEHQGMAKEIKATLRTRVYVQELARRADAAEAKAADAEQHESNLAVKLDPGERRPLPFGLGAAIVVALVILDAFPLNWAAQAFDLDSGGTWVVTVILLIASIGAMLGFELTRGHSRRRGILIAVVTAGFLALLGLRTQYLTTVVGDSFPVAVFQAAAADRHLRWARPVRFGGADPDPVRYPLPGPRRCPARRPGRQ